MRLEFIVGCIAGGLALLCFAAPTVFSYVLTVLSPTTVADASSGSLGCAFSSTAKIRSGDAELLKAAEKEDTKTRGLGLGRYDFWLQNDTDVNVTGTVELRSDVCSHKNFSLTAKSAVKIENAYFCRPDSIIIKTPKWVQTFPFNQLSGGRFPTTVHIFRNSNGDSFVALPGYDSGARQ